jgi:hypothetical protein
MGRQLIYGKKSIWIVERVSSRNARVPQQFKTTGELADWLVSLNVVTVPLFGETGRQTSGQEDARNREE